MLGFFLAFKKFLQIGKTASSKFWDRQISLERDDLDTDDVLPHQATAIPSRSLHDNNLTNVCLI